jgi:ribosomal protein L37AE/L43A
MTNDARCPECHGAPDLKRVLPDRLLKACTECGHRWAEPREKTVLEAHGINGRFGPDRFDDLFTKVKEKKS